MASVVMPQPGQSVTEGTVVKWLKQVGDHVVIDEILVEVETEKVNIELPSPFDGTLTEILVPEGETVEVGADLALVAVAGEDEPAAAPVAAAERATGSPSADNDQQWSAQRAVAEAPPAAVAGSNGARGNGVGRYSPAVLRLAAEHNVDLGSIQGTGMGGRVTRKDVAQFLERGGGAPPAARGVAPPAPAIATTSAGAAGAGIAEERELAASFTSAAADAAASPPDRSPEPARSAPQAATADDVEFIRPSPTRLTIARNMLRTAQSVPTAWMVVEVDMTALVRLREQLRNDFRRREGVDLTYLPFVVQAVTASLREQPMLNSEWRDDQIVLKKRINIGVAVGADDGLIVPVIQNADRLSITGLAHAIADLAARGRTRKLKIEEVTGGTFTIDNTGVFGSLVSQPIINPPQAAILSTEAIVKRPVVIDDAIAVRSMMNLCIAFDHRILDGTQVGPFMQAVKRRLELYTPATSLT